MVKRHEIQVLRRRAIRSRRWSNSPASRKAAWQRVEAEAPVSTFDTAGERRQRRIGRPSKVEVFRSFLVAELAKQPKVLAVELLRRARLAGYAGSALPTTP